MQYAFNYDDGVQVKLSLMTHHLWTWWHVWVLTDVHSQGNLTTYLRGFQPDPKTTAPTFGLVLTRGLHWLLWLGHVQQSWDPIIPKWGCLKMCDPQSLDDLEVPPMLGNLQILTIDILKTRHDSPQESPCLPPWCLISRPWSCCLSSLRAECARATRRTKQRWEIRAEEAWNCSECDIQQGEANIWLCHAAVKWEFWGGVQLQPYCRWWFMMKGLLVFWATTRFRKTGTGLDSPQVLV